MRRFRITIEGETYEVEVEEVGTSTHQSEHTVQTGTGGTAAGAPVEDPAPENQASAQAKPAAADTGSKDAAAETSSKQEVESPLPGLVLDIKVEPGDAFQAGDVLLVLEAMKMENEIPAPSDGRVSEIHVESGDSVDQGQVLLTYD